MSRPLAYNPALDGLRAGAVTAVVLVHAGFHIDGGYGVVLFFVLSGYLITGLLLAERESSGTLDLRGFYRRRFARLAPALAVITVATCAWLVLARTPIREWFAGLLGVLTYSADFIDVSGWGDSVGGHWSWAWSLSVEEQFYLLWPALLLLVFRGGTARWSRQRFALVALLVVAAAWLSRAQMVAGDASRERIKYSFDSNMDALAWGALLALVVTGRSASPRARRVAGIVTPVAAAMFAIEVIHPQWVRGVLAFDANALGLVALTSVVLVAGVVIAPRSPFARVLGWRPLAHLGRLSYGIYLWNEFLWHVDMDVFGGSPRENVVGMVLTIAVLVGICELSYRAVEVPLRRRWAHRRVAVPEPRAALAST